MMRRKFLRIGSGLLAAAALPAFGQTTRRAIRKAVKFEMIAGEMSVLEKFRLLKSLGFDGVEMMSPADYDPAEVLAARDATGVVIHGVVDSEHWRSPLSDPDPAVRDRGRKALEQGLRDCKRYGGTTVLLVPAIVNGRVSYADAWQRSRAEIRPVLPLAEELGIKIALENVWNNFLLSPLEAARYVDEFENPWIGWYFDVGNVVRYGWPDQWIRILGDRILKLDIKEYSRGKRDNEGLWKGFNVEIGDGDCDWPAVRAALRDIGFAGWATAEVRGGDAARLTEISERMDGALGL
ncbi:MAG: sugar phosphate isomerase/epimerase family protein [Planctomycetota bacterium]